MRPTPESTPLDREEGTPIAAAASADKPQNCVGTSAHRLQTKTDAEAFLPGLDQPLGSLATTLVNSVFVDRDRPTIAAELVIHPHESDPARDLYPATWHRQIG